MAAPRSGSGFVNFSQFLDANQGAIGRTRSAMADPVRQRFQNAGTDRAYGLENTRRLIGANTLGPYDPLKVGTHGEAYGATTYGGPTSAMEDENYAIGYGNAVAGNKDAQRQANIYGRAGALRDQFGANSPTYTAGNQMFDSALLGAKGGRSAYDANAKAGGHLLDAFKADAGAIASEVGAAKQATSDAAGKYREAWNAPPALGNDNKTTPLPQAPAAPATLGDIYTQRNDPGYLNEGRPGAPKKKPNGGR